jgi:hypothetical protein
MEQLDVASTDPGKCFALLYAPPFDVQFSNTGHDGAVTGIVTDPEIVGDVA